MLYMMMVVVFNRLLKFDYGYLNAALDPFVVMKAHA